MFSLSIFTSITTTSILVQVTGVLPVVTDVLPMVSFCTVIVFLILVLRLCNNDRRIK